MSCQTLGKEGIFIFSCGRRSRTYSRELMRLGLQTLDSRIKRDDGALRLSRSAGRQCRASGAACSSFDQPTTKSYGPRSRWLDSRAVGVAGFDSRPRSPPARREKCWHDRPRKSSSFETGNVRLEGSGALEDVGRGHPPLARALCRQAAQIRAPLRHRALREAPRVESPSERRWEAVRVDLVPEVRSADRGAPRALRLDGRPPRSVEIVIGEKEEIAKT